MAELKIGDKVNFIKQKRLLTGVITKFYKNEYNVLECSVKVTFDNMSHTIPHIALSKVKKVEDDDLLTELTSKVELLESEKSNLSRTLEEANEKIQELQHSQNKKAIKVLKELREEFCQPYSDDVFSAGKIEEAIDEQIAKLGETNE